MKKLFILMLIFLTACTNSNGGENGTGNGNGITAASTSTAATGRYIEKEITPPIDGQIISMVAPDGTLVAFDAGLKTRYDSTDNGLTWTESAGPGQGNENFDGVQSATMLPDGDLLVYMLNSGMTRISPDGTTTHFPIETIDNEIAEGDIHIVSLMQTNGEQLLLSYDVDWMARIMRENMMEGMRERVEAHIERFVGTDGDVQLQTDGDTDFPQIRMEGQEVQSSETTEVRIEASETREIHVEASSPRGGVRGGSVTVSSGGATGARGGMMRSGGGPGGFTMRGMSGMPKIYDMSGNLISELEMFDVIGASGNDIFSLQGHTIMRHSENGDVDTFLDGTAFVFGSTTGRAVSAQLLDNGSLLVNVVTNENVLADDEINRLFLYTWDENATVSPEKTITIWALQDNELVRAAITEMWLQHPDASITFEIALSGEDAVSASDAIRTLNTRLLSNRGPDIVILDGVPIDSYAGRGMLLDLSDKINTNAIYSNLLAPYYDNEKLYVTPTQFYIPVLMGSAEKLNEVQTLSALTQAVVNGNPPAPMMRGEGMLGGIPEEERAALHFNDLPELFEIMWQVNASAFINDNRLDSDILREFLETFKAISDKYELAVQEERSMEMVMATRGGRRGRVNMMSGSIMRYMMQFTNYGALTVSNLPILQMMMDMNDSQFALFPGITQNGWIPSTIVGISADTPNVDFSTAFVNKMLSNEVQQVNHGLGLPITREGMQLQLDQINESLLENDMPPFSLDIDSIVAQLTTPAIIETTLREMIWTTTERLCTDRIDINTAVQEIEQSIRNYLAERS